ncbi:Na(+)/H(+) antiporter subunit B [Lentisalinibacter orientalis]|uniref:Na(+)/H(+) antiporter subunit B n=1 Tax=Lentisalinibacter orientalis TaxID=2992241 RepID=UPI0038669D08
MNAALVLDFVLVLVLLWVAWAALWSRDLFRGIVLFIAFGMVLALVWIRLGAPDVGLAEAAIGAGLTGALLLATWGALPHGSGTPDGEDEPEEEPGQDAEETAPGGSDAA